MKETTEKLTELLERAYIDAHDTVLLAGDDTFRNFRGDYVSPYEVLVKTEKLRDAVSRGRDLFSVIVAQIEQREMEFAQRTCNESKNKTP
jgi:hypothetical protein